MQRTAIFHSLTLVLAQIAPPGESPQMQPSVLPLRDLSQAKQGLDLDM